MNKQKHLTLEERAIIEIELGKKSSFKAIALLVVSYLNQSFSLPNSSFL